MLFHYDDLAEITSRFHREYRSTRRSKKPIALLITNPEPWCEARDIYEKTIRYFSELGEDISDHVYTLDPECTEEYARIIRKEKTCVAVDKIIQIKDRKISRFSIRNLETTHGSVHDFITCISNYDRWAIPEIKNMLTDIGFHVVLYEFRVDPHHNFKKAAIARVIDDTTNPRIRAKELEITWQWLSDPKDLSDLIELKRHRCDIPVFLNKVQVHKSHQHCEYDDTRALLCPGCLKAVTFGKDKKAHKYVKTRPVEEFDELDRVSTCGGFAHHTRLCRPAFPQDGISKVVTDPQRYIVKKLGKLSKSNGGWTFPSVDEDFFAEGKGTVYVYVRDRAPVSYAAFHRQDIPCHGSADIIWDLYTLPPYRGRGLATSVLDHGIEELKINRECLPVSLPPSKHSKRIIWKASTKDIIDVDGTVTQRDEFLRWYTRTSFRE